MRSAATWLVSGFILFACQSRGADGGSVEKATRAKELGGERMGVQKSRPKVGGLGERRLEGKASDLRATPDGTVMTALLDAVKPRLEGVPGPMRLGELWAVPTAPGAVPKRLGNGVTNVGGGQLFTADSQWSLYLTGFNATQQAGELWAQALRDLKQEPVRLAGAVSYFVPSDDSKQLAFVEEGVLKLGPLPSGPFRAVAGEVATAEFTRDGNRLFFRRRVSAAGGLFVVSVEDLGATPRKVTDLVGEFEVTRDGKGLAYLARPTLASPTFELFVGDATTLKVRKVADGVIRFALSPDGRQLAWISGPTPTQPGDFFLAPSATGVGKKLGERVRDFQFSVDSARLAFRQHYREVQLVGEQLERVGELLLVDLATGSLTSVQKTCANYVFSPDGRALAYAGTVFRPIFTRHLYLLRAGATEPARLKEWIYEYVFDAKSERLFFRSDCSREGRSCFLYSVDVGQSEAQPRQEGESVYHFRVSQDGGRALFTYAQTQNDMFDVSVLNLKTKVRTTIEQDIHLPVHFLEADGARLGYVVAAKGRSGVYIAAQQIP
jgi:dipeptidyl aminopeptidase/acylaminoacyl peptidase